MKITFLLPVVHQNGGSRVIAIYAKALLAMGHDVTVVSRKPRVVSPQRKIVNRIKGVSYTHEAPDRDAYFRDLGARHVQLDFKEPIDATDVPDADMIVATWWRTAFEVAALPPEKGKKVYFIQHHEVHGHLPWDLSAGSYFLPLRKITICSWLVDLMKTRYNDSDVLLVPNGVDTDHFHAPTRTRNKRPRVGLLYAPAAFKGIDIGLAAIERVKEHIPDLELVVFGATRPSGDLVLPEGITFHESPSQNDIPAIYADADVWLVPSREEGFGLPILEAMACRTPVVATRTGAAPDLIVDGLNGHVVDVDDVEALADRLISVLQLSESDWQAMSGAAYACAQENTSSRAAQRFEAALQTIADQADGAP